MKIALGLIISVGLAYRLLFLGARQPWTEELMQAIIVRSSSLSDMLQRLRGGILMPEPLDYLIQKGVVLLLGEAHWVLRLHAALFGTLSIGIVYMIARLLFGGRIALYSAALFAISPLPHHYSQEGRPYALFLFLVLCSWYLLLRRVKGNQKGIEGWIGLCGSLVALLYSSSAGIAVIVSQCLALTVLALRGPEGTSAGREQLEHGEMPDLPKARFSQIAAYLAAAGVALVLFYPWMHHLQGGTAAPASVRLSDPMLLLSLFKEMGDNSYPAAALLWLGAAAGIRALARHGRRRSLLSLFVWFGAIVPVLLLLQVWRGYTYTARDVLAAIPPLIILAGYGLSYVGERMRILDRLPYQISSPAIVYAALMLVISLWISQGHARREPVDWKGTAQALHRMAVPGAVVALPGVYPLLQYHVPALARFRVDDLDPDPHSTAAATRRIVACYDGMATDPCAGFRGRAVQDSAWVKRGYRGFTVFVHQRQQVGALEEQRP